MRFFGLCKAPAAAKTKGGKPSVYLRFFFRLPAFLKMTLYSRFES